MYAQRIINSQILTGNGNDNLEPFVLVFLISCYKLPVQLVTVLENWRTYWYVCVCGCGRVYLCMHLLLLLLLFPFFLLIYYFVISLLSMCFTDYYVTKLE